MNVLVGYGANAHLGLLHGMNKLVPALRGKGEIERLASVKDSVFWFNILLGAVAAFITFLASYTVSSLYAGGLRIVSLIIFVQMLFTYLFCILRADGKFGLVSSGIAVSSGFSAVLVILFSYLHPNPVLGALLGLLISNIIVVLYWLISAGYTFAYKVSYEDIKSSFYLGIPLIILGIVDMCLFSADRWVVAAKLGPESLGYYAIAIMAVNILGLASVSLSNVLFPHMVEKFAENNNTVGTGNLLLKPLNAIASAIIIVIFFALMALPIVIKVFIPKYLPSIPLLEILLPAAFFSSLAAIAGTYIISINKQAILVAVQLLALVFALSLDLYFVKSGYGIIGVAYGTFLGYTISGLCYAGISVFYATNDKMKSIFLILRLIAPFCAMLLVFLLASKFCIILSVESWSFQALAFKAGLAVTIFLPIFWVIYGKAELFQLVAAHISVVKMPK